MAFTFGQSTAGASSAVGAPSAPASSPFAFGGGAGSASQQQQQQPQTTFGSSGFRSSGLFGSSTAQPPQTQAPAGFGTSSLFGGQSTGAQSGAQQQQQQQQPGSLFGGGLFGSTSSAQPQPQPQHQAPNPLTLSQLSGPASYQQPARSGFGATNASAATSNLGGGGSGGLGSDSNTANKRLGVPMNDKIEHVRASWDVQNIQTCQFLYYFYNALPLQPANIGELALRDPNFGRRQDAIGPRHDALWLQCLRENPDRAKLVPVLAVGFNDLKARIDAQQAESSRQSAKMNELQKRLDALTSKHSLSNSVRISAISRKQTSLHHRLVGLAKRIHLLIPALRGHSVTLQEERLRSLLSQCEMELDAIASPAEGQRQGSGGGAVAAHHRLRGRINELWALLGTLKAKREAALAANNGSAPLEWAVVDESAIEDVVKILASQQQGLDHLSTTLQSDVRILDTIVKGLEGVELIGVR